jgi:uncharacterized membrane protein
METRRRTILKALIWNLIGLLSMSAIGYLATGSVALGGGIAVINTLVGLICYLVYERIWLRINWGRHV